MFGKFQKMLISTLVFLLFFLTTGFLANCLQAASPLQEKLKGHFLIQVEDHGQLWYLTPDSGKKILIENPDSVFKIIKKYGLGIKSVELKKYLESSFPERLKAKILLDVDNNGEAYYVNPLDMKGYYLGNKDNIISIIGGFALGISNDNLFKIEFLNNEENITEKKSDNDKDLEPVVETFKPEPMYSFTKIVNVQGEVSNCDNEDIEEKGILWGHNSGLTIDNNKKKIEDGSGIGKINVDILGLMPGTTNYVRAYALSGQEVFYGNEEVISGRAGSIKTPISAPLMNNSAPSTPSPAPTPTPTPEPTPEVTQYTLTYETTGGCGSLSGETSQTINEGSDGTPVSAIYDAELCRFYGWSIGEECGLFDDDCVNVSDEWFKINSEENPRTDTNVTSSLTVTAVFQEPMPM